MDRTDALARLLRRLAAWVESRPDLVEPIFGQAKPNAHAAPAEAEVVNLVARFCGALLAGAQEHARTGEVHAPGAAVQQHLGGMPREELLAVATAARATFADSEAEADTESDEPTRLEPGSDSGDDFIAAAAIGMIAPTQGIDAVDAAIDAATATTDAVDAAITAAVAPVLHPADAASLLKIGNGIAPALVATASGALGIGAVRPKRERRAAHFAHELQEIADCASRMSAAFRAKRSLEKNPFDQLALRQLDRSRHALLDHHLTAWPCDRDLDRARRISGERMYELLAQSARVLAETLGRVPEPLDDRPARFKGPVRDLLEAAVHLTIEVQCMVKSFALSIGLPKQAPTASHYARCGVQDRLFRLLREIITDRGGGYQIYSDSISDSASRHFGLRERRSLRHRLDALRRRLDPDFDAAAACGGAIAEPEADEAMLELTHEDRAAEADFDTVAEAVDRARTELQELQSPVIIAETALRSAEDSPFQRPDDAFEFLMALHKLAVQWRTRGGALGMSWDTGLRALGYGEKRLSETARSRYRRHYEQVWRGERRVFELHWTMGSRDANHCLSIHWWRDDERREVIVGWAGRHLPNTMT